MDLVEIYVTITSPYIPDRVPIRYPPKQWTWILC